MSGNPKCSKARIVETIVDKNLIHSTTHPHHQQIQPKLRRKESGFKAYKRCVILPKRHKKIHIKVHNLSLLHASVPFPKISKSNSRTPRLLTVIFLYFVNYRHGRPHCRQCVGQGRVLAYWVTCWQVLGQGLGVYDLCEKPVRRLGGG